MSHDLSQFHQIFFDEAREHLADMESRLVALDVAAPDAEELNAIFRAAHSIKGGAATFGFADMQALTHELETLLDQVRRGERAPTDAMVSALLHAADVLGEQLAGHRDGHDVDPAGAHAVEAELEALVRQDGGAAGVPAQRARCIIWTPVSPPPSGAVDGLLAALAEYGALTVRERPQAGAGRWIFEVAGAHSDDTLRELFDFIAAPDEVAIDDADAAAGCDAGGSADRADEDFGFFDGAPGTPEDDGYGFFDPPAPAPAAEDFGFFDGSPGVPEDPGYGFFDPPAIVEADEGFGLFDGAPGAPGYGAFDPPAAASGRRASDGSQPAPVRTDPRANPKTAVSTAEAASIRVGTEKVDQLINLVGELVITQAMLAQASGALDPALHERVLAGVAQLERNSRDLQEAAMSIRMMPVSSVFSRFPRLVRDLAQKLGKQVELKLVGEGTELDKGLIEKIADPLTHLVRNSIDHGLEAPAARESAGKPARGTVTLSAAHQGGSIVIEVRDDGAGLDRARILAKARERALAMHDDMSDDEVWQLIFAPGFSTAAEVTDVSGRGVGMDVVRKNIHALGGSVHLASRAGQGSAVTIRVPLTLAILDGMSLRVAGEVLILPLGFVVESLQADAMEYRSVGGERWLVRVREEYLPAVDLGELLSLRAGAGRPDKGVLVVVEAENRKLALAVDELVGQHQVVIKSLEANYRRVPGVAGATILGDGRVALILDVAALTTLAHGAARGAQRAA